MNRLNGFVKVVASLCLLGFLMVALAGAAFVNAGTMMVQVHEKSSDGVSLTLPVPVALARLGLAFVPDEYLAEARHELEPWMPAVEALLSELARCADGVLVEVESEDERVSIIKRGNSLIIDVDTRDEEVHLSIPVKAVASLVMQFASGGSKVACSRCWV